jgi:hypothetical protein
MSTPDPIGEDQPEAGPSSLVTTDPSTGNRSIFAFWGSGQLAPAPALVPIKRKRKKAEDNQVGQGQAKLSMRGEKSGGLAIERPVVRDVVEGEIGKVQGKTKGVKAVKNDEDAERREMIKRAKQAERAEKAVAIKGKRKDGVTAVGPEGQVEGDDGECARWASSNRALIIDGSRYDQSLACQAETGSTTQGQKPAYGDFTDCIITHFLPSPTSPADHHARLPYAVPFAASQLVVPR